MLDKTKKKCISITISSEDKEIIERAAKHNTLSVSSYIISVVLKQAIIDLRTNEPIILNSNERNNFIKVLNKSSKPNQNLKELFK